MSVGHFFGVEVQLDDSEKVGSDDDDYWIRTGVLTVASVP